MGSLPNGGSEAQHHLAEAVVAADGRLDAGGSDRAAAGGWELECPGLAYEIQQLYALYVCAAFPEQPRKAIDVGLCESGLGRHPDTFRLEQDHGGVFQLARYGVGWEGWESWFLRNYGWEWEAIVNDPETHVAAVRIVYDRAGGWVFAFPVCGWAGG